jgi:hypothetical protein
LRERKPFYVQFNNCLTRSNTSNRLRKKLNGLADLDRRNCCEKTRNALERYGPRPPSPLTKNKRQPKLPRKLRQWRTKKLPRQTGRGLVLDHAAFSSPGFLGDVQQRRLVILGQKAVDRRQRIRTKRT